MRFPPATVDDDTADPRTVHISDIHGYLADARSALRAVGDASQYPDLVTTDGDGRLHWADNEYILVINGDAIDRGPDSEGCLELIWRLQEQAPAGRVRYHLGNHELAILLPSLVHWPNTFSTELSPSQRDAFLKRVDVGAVTVAFDGYCHTYSHAGQNEPFDVKDVNEVVQRAAGQLLNVDGDDTVLQRRLEQGYGRVFGFGTGGGRGPDAGLCWMDFAHLKSSAPPQIVGHTKHITPARKGNVICGNVIRTNHRSPGGEGVLIEDPTSVTAVRRGPDGSVSVSTI